MGVFRVLGLIGSASCLGILIFFLYDEGFPDLDKPLEIWFALSLALLIFNFFPISATKIKIRMKDSLLGLWIESKKARLRKQIKEIDKT